MGQKVTHSWEDYRNPLCSPRTDRPPTFDPLAGFPNGRKKREMVATLEEMDLYQLDMESRDYCAHKKIDWKKCQLESRPFGAWYCSHRKHDYIKCTYDDYILRIKEYERERRLLRRKLRKEQAATAAVSGNLSV